MKDSDYAEDSQKMIVQMKFLEFRISAIEKKIEVTEEDWLKAMENFNIGREILDRGFLKMFFGGGPKGINLRIRKALVDLMLRVDRGYPQIKGPNFDESLKDLVRRGA